jgi:aminoglycoside phosphotransferase (APT) family kinase protein
VIAFVHRRGEAQPCVIVKASRRPGDHEGLEREADVLQRLDALLGPRGLRIPAVLGVIRQDGQTLLVQSVVRGRPLSPARVRRNRRRALELGLGFIERLPLTRPAGADPDWYDAAVTGPLARLAAVVPLDGETEDLVARTSAVLEPLRSAALPAVLEHGDLAHPNLLVARAGAGLGVIDWERSTTEGVPGHDLSFYLQFVSEASLAPVPAAQREAFGSAFTGTDGWAVPILRDHLRKRGVDPRQWGRIVLASWARTAATLGSRLSPESGTGGAAASRAVQEAARATREMMLWRHALESAERGQLSAS